MKINTSISIGNLISFMGILLLTPMLIYPLLSQGNMLLLTEFAVMAISCYLIIRKIHSFAFKDKLIIMWLLTILPVVINSNALANRQIGYTVLFVSILIFILAAIQYQGYSFKNLIILIGVLTCIYTISTIVFSCNLDFGLSSIAMLFRTKIYQGTLASAGFTSHYTHNSMYIALGAVAWFAFAVNTKKKTHIILCLLSIVAMLFTQKRGPLIALVISMLLTAVIRERGTLSKRLGKYLVVGIVILFLIYIAYLLFPVLFAVFDRFSNNDNMLSNRQYFWEYAWDLFKSSPILGHGWAYYANTLNLTIKTIDVTLQNTHNIYLQLLAETGIIGTLIFIVPMIFTLFTCIKQIRENTKAIVAPELAFSFCFQIFFLIYGFSENPLYDRQMFIPYMLAVAITLYHEVSYKISKRKVGYVKAKKLS